MDDFLDEWINAHAEELAPYMPAIRDLLRALLIDYTEGIDE